MSGETFLVGVVVTLEPLPILGYILVLSTPNGIRKGLGFLLGWLVSLIAIFAAMTGLLADRTSTTSSTAASSGIATSVAMLLLGVWALVAAIRRHNHPKLGPTKRPGWTKKVDGIGFWGAVLLGVLLQPWGFVAAGAAQIHARHLPAGQEVAAFVVFGLLCTASLLVMQGWALVAPGRATARLSGLRSWIEQHRNGTITGVLAVVGVWLLVQGTYTLVA